MKRVAPDPEFVLMYRKGIPPVKIAALVGLTEATVRYHLQIAARTEPSIRKEHDAARLPRARKLPEAGLRNLADVIAFHESEGRLPGPHGKTARERALGAWLVRRRRESANGSLALIYRDALAIIPAWEKLSTRKGDDEARWQHRLEELQKIREAGGDWPRHQKTVNEDERKLGVWLHGQRIDYRAARLAPEKEKKLNEILPGWKEGRGRRGSCRTSRSEPYP